MVQETLRDYDLRLKLFSAEVAVIGYLYVTDRAVCYLAIVLEIFASFLDEILKWLIIHYLLIIGKTLISGLVRINEYLAALLI